MANKYHRRHYEDLARVLRDQRGLSSPCTVSQTDVWYALGRLEDQLVELFETDNPRFNVKRFRTAARP